MLLLRHEGHVPWLPNPEGLLQCRPFMQRWLPKYKIHYCAYGHKYQKATMIWTDLEWQPKGTTGDGKCTEASRCQQGSYREDTGSFRHNHTLGQESQNEVGGKGRVAYKASVPQGLHEELLSLVMQQLE